MGDAAIPFFQPYLTGRELPAVAEAILSRRWSGNGPFARRCSETLLKMTGRPSFLTPTGTHALEIAVMALGADPGGEVILPSYTFASTATCLLQAGLTPVFVDVREDTLNIDESLIDQAVTPHTRAIMPVHYAGVAADMDAIDAIARRHGLAVIEDAAQGVNASYKGRPLGTLGDLGAYSFHESKNFACGQGGAIVVGNERYLGAVEIHREVGTDRCRFLRGEIPQYAWVDRGSNYLLSDILAALLLPQLEAAEEITGKRRALYRRYLEGLGPLHHAGRLRLPVIPDACQSNYHLFHLLVESAATRDSLRAHLKARGIGSALHYAPLHQTPGGRRFGVARGPLKVAEMVGERLLRLPFYTEMTHAQQDLVIASVFDFFDSKTSPT
jgi:dTDP-4-amino-4,6-dideoxygalactose transaminase